MDPIQNQAPQATPVVNEKSHGSLIGIVIIVILVVVAALYFMNNKPSSTSEVQTTSESENTASVETVENVPVPEVSSEDDIDSIDSDLNAGTGADVDFDTSDLDSSL